VKWKTLVPFSKFPVNQSQSKDKRAATWSQTENWKLQSANCS